VSAGLGPPSDRCAIIVRTTLPVALERMRREFVRNAAEGVPAHLTLMVPFVGLERLTPEVRAMVAAVAANHPAFHYTLARRAVWRDSETLYVAVEPVAPFVELQAALQRAFPDFPIYGRAPGFDFVPHVTVAEGPSFAAAPGAADRAWASLPRPAVARSIEVITQAPGAPWRTTWRIPLAG
jgi:2'-5' RNA ligase